MHVSFLVYSATPSRRSVALNIEGPGLIVLREGDEANGFVVNRILPNGVELLWGGMRFRVPARD